MNTSMALVAALIVLPAAALLGWAWHTTVQLERGLRSFSGFDGLNFDIGHLARPAQPLPSTT